MNNLLVEREDSLTSCTSKSVSLKNNNLKLSSISGLLVILEPGEHLISTGHRNPRDWQLVLPIPRVLPLNQVLSV